MSEVEVVVAHAERATVRAGDVFIKIDSDPARLDRELAAMDLAPVPTGEVLWRQPQAMAVARVRGERLARLGEVSSAPASVWRAVGAVVRRLHEAPVPALPGRPAATIDVLARECEALVGEGILPVSVVIRHQELASRVVRSFEPAFTHGDLQPEHVFVEGGGANPRVTGIIDWSEGGPGDPLFDLATLTLGHAARLPDLLDGYEASGHMPVDASLVEAWWSWRCLTNIRWLAAHGFDPFLPGGEGDMLLGGAWGR
ncbi:phosphotransferase family enzyme [Frondihabitans australicus]|uniref:Phosphotransferase family enzyme n=1 Tax=Frondihabitans australicus TaxID=386892 RepID=A0A495IFL3_9MICO|nr:phosphotransferase family enzyme [Frondihabitans australicus]